MIKSIANITILSLLFLNTSLFSQDNEPRAEDDNPARVEEQRTDNNTEVKNTNEEIKTRPEEKSSKPAFFNNFFMGLNAGYGGKIIKKSSSSDNPYWLNSVNIMLMAEYAFSRSLSLYTELGYQHGILTNVTVTSKTAVDGQYTEQDSLSSVEWNISARYYIPDFINRLRLFTGLGINVGYMDYYIEIPQVSNIVSNGVESVTVTTPAGHFHGTGYFLGANASLGALYKIEENLSLSLNARFSYNFLSQLTWETSNQVTDMTHMDFSVTIAPVMHF